MKTLHTNNKNPSSLKYTEMYDLIMDSSVEGHGLTVGVGNNTTAFLTYELSEEVKVRFHDTVIAVLPDDETVSLFTGGFFTETTKRRMDWCLLPLGYRMATDNGVGNGRIRWGNNHKGFKVYRIKDGMYLPYTEGMTLPRSR